MMTLNEVAALQLKWKQRADRTACKHLRQELEWDEQGYLTGDYVCILCGKSCGPRGFSLVASPTVPAPSTARYPHCDY